MDFISQELILRNSHHACHLKRLFINLGVIMDNSHFLTKQDKTKYVYVIPKEKCVQTTKTQQKKLSFKS